MTGDPAGPARQIATLTAADMAGWPGTPMALMTNPHDQQYRDHVVSARTRGRKMAERFAELSDGGTDTLVAALMVAAEEDSPRTFGLARGLAVRDAQITQFIFAPVSRETDLTGLEPSWNMLEDQVVLATQSKSLGGQPGAVLIVPETIYPAQPNRRPESPSAKLLDDILRWHGAAKVEWAPALNFNRQNHPDL